jgi:hypothetical protein
MSVVIDGKDILQYNSLMAITMSERLNSLLVGKENKIPKATLDRAKKFLSVGMDEVRLARGQEAINAYWEEERERWTTYRLLTDMLKRVKKIDEKDVDSELEKLAIVAEVLTSDGKQLLVAREHYQTLQKVFRAMYDESANYVSAFGQHSPYSIGTFDDSDDD